MTPRSIDLNCDLGESPERAADGTDLALLDAVSSANIACGGHAGDESTMAETVRAAISRGVAVGAHPGYPDRARFGRFELDMTVEEIEAAVFEQFSALDRVVGALGTHLRHVKPHGALYHAAMARPPVAEALARAAARVSGGLILVGQAGTAALGVWRGQGFRVAAEAFADRRYEPDGSLRARTLPGALLTDPAEAASQALRIARGQGVVACDGTIIPLRADTIGVHGDTPGAVAVVRAVRAGLEQAGVVVRRVHAAGADGLPSFGGAG